MSDFKPSVGAGNAAVQYDVIHVQYNDDTDRTIMLPPTFIPDSESLSVNGLVQHRANNDYSIVQNTIQINPALELKPSDQIRVTFAQEA